MAPWKKLEKTTSSSSSASVEEDPEEKVQLTLCLTELEPFNSKDQSFCLFWDVFQKYCWDSVNWSIGSTFSSESSKPNTKLELDMGFFHFFPRGRAIHLSVRADGVSSIKNGLGLPLKEGQH